MFLLSWDQLYNTIALRKAKIMGHLKRLIFHLGQTENLWFYVSQYLSTIGYVAISDVEGL